MTEEKKAHMNENRVKNANGMVENVIEWIDGDDYVAVTLSSRNKNKLIKLAEKFPDDVDFVRENKDGSVFGHIPLKWVAMRKPRQVNYTDEQRKEIAERFALSRNSSTTIEKDTDFE